MDSYMSQWQKQRELREKAYEALAGMGKKVQVFHDTLAAYNFPPEAVEKYVDEFRRGRERLVNGYVKEKLEAAGTELKDTAEVIIELGWLDSAEVGELKLDELTPLQRDYRKNMLQLHIGLLQKALEEHP